MFVWNRLGKASFVLLSAGKSSKGTRRARFVRLATLPPSVSALGFRFVLFGFESYAFARNAKS